MKNLTAIIKAFQLIPALCVLGLYSNAQVIQEVQNSFNLYKQSALQEKIFVHTDKSTYLSGEILWFKIYCVDGNDHRPLNLSKVAYVDLLDNNQNPVAQAKVAMENGSGSGSIYIPVSVSNGSYRFRAYTNWMKNFSPDYYFEKPVILINPLRSPESVSKAGAATYDVQFFPEGGNLVNGVNSKVGFKVVGTDGKGVAVRGAVLDQKNDTLVRFSSLKFGMGSFNFTPVAGDKYKAVIVANGQKAAVQALPAIMSQGYVMALTENGRQLDISVKANTGDGAIYLFTHTRQDLKDIQTASLSNGTAHFLIDKNKLGDGISHITVFNTNKQPVCERLYFKRPQKQLMINATADQQEYGIRKKVIARINSIDAAGKLMKADLSLSVFRVDSVQAIESGDIFSYLWLSSDLKGNIESPGYYFAKDDAATTEAMDNLMLTQGWRRFDWSKLLQNNTQSFTFLPEYSGHLITAKVVNAQTGAPAKDVITYLGIPGKRVQLYVSQSDSAGRLIYNTRNFFGPNEIVDQTNPLVDSTVRIDIASPFSEQYSKTVLPHFTFTPGMAPALQEHNLGIQTLNIFSGNKIKRVIDPLRDSSAFYGKPFKTYLLDNFVRFTTMEEDLREYVSEDNIVRSRGHFHIKVLNEHGFQDGDPLVLVDGVPVFNIDKVIALDPLKIRKLEVVRDHYFYGPTDAKGVFSFTSYKGDLGGVDLDPKAVVVDYEGIQMARQFYSPVYDTETAAASRIPDFRNLLYWAPVIDPQDKGIVSFYTSDQPGRYVGVVQGITSNGNAGSQTFTFEVR